MTRSPRWRESTINARAVLGALRAGTVLKDDAFTSKGAAAASWHTSQRTTMLQAAQASSESFKNFGTGFAAVASLFTAADQGAEQAAHNHGKGGG